MTERTIQQLDDYVQNIYLQIEREILDNVGKALMMPQGEVDIREWQMLKLQQLGPLTAANYKYLTSQTGLTESAVNELILKEGIAASALVDSYIGASVSASALSASNTIISRLAAIQAQAKSKFNLVNTSMLNGSQQFARNIINETTAKVLTGMRTPHEALIETAGRWAEKGIPTIRDKAGRKWSVEAYVPMVIKSTRKNVTAEMQLGRMDDHDIDLVEVSSKIGARPKCAPYQGRIFSKSGTSTKYPAFSTTSYGEPDGLLGINCGHNIYPFMEGKSTQRYKPYPEEQNDKQYKEAQQQRSIERAIRAKKKRLSMMEKLKAPEGIKEAKQQLRQQQNRMREFIKATGRGRRYNREAIV